METKEYVEYLLENYNEILKDIEQLKFEYETFIEVIPEEMIDTLNFSGSTEERVNTSSISDKTCKIALIYNEVANNLNKDARREILKMIKVSEYEITKLNYYIKRLDLNIQSVIKLFYFDKKNLSDISKQLSIVERTVTNYKNKGIYELTYMYNLKKFVV